MRKLALAVAVLATLAACAQTAAAAPSRTLKTAIIDLRFRNDPATIGNIEAGRATMFDGPRSLRAFYESASAGDLTIAGRDHARGDLYGLYTLPFDNIATAPCDAGAWARAAESLAPAGIKDYDRVVLALPKLKMPCNWDGLASTPGRYVWLNGNFDLGILVHEFGHTFGWPHSGVLRCKDAGGAPTAISGSCTEEGGDPFSLMSTGAVRTPTTFQLLGGRLLDPAKREVVTQTGTYHLKPLSPTAGAGIRALTVPRQKGDSFEIEYRRPDAGFDNFAPTDPVVNGITVRLSMGGRPPADLANGRLALLDANPATPTPTDAPLAVGKTLTDPVSGVAITLVSADAGGASVQVTMPRTPDIQGPTKPTNIVADNGYASSPSSPTVPVNLSWSPSTDNVGVAGYKVFRGGTLIGTTTSTTFTDTTAPRMSWAFYSVEAYDAWGWSSEPAQHSHHANELPYAPRIHFELPDSGDRVGITRHTLSDLPIGYTFVKRDGETLTLIPKESNSYEDKTVKPGHHYTYKIHTNSLYGHPGAVTTCEVTVPGPSTPGSHHCTGTPMTPAAARHSARGQLERGLELPDNAVPFLSRRPGAGAMFRAGDRVLDWAFEASCPGDDLAHAVLTPAHRRSIAVGEDGRFRYRGFAKQAEASADHMTARHSHLSHVVIRGRFLGQGRARVFVEDDRMHCGGPADEAGMRISSQVIGMKRVADPAR